MKNSTKGALAAAAAGTLLLGGAGSLAYWNSTSDVGGLTAIDSGHLKLVKADGGNNDGSECTAWKLVHPATTGHLATSVDFTTQKIVPGDELTRDCNYTVDMTGTNLAATLSITGGELDTLGTLTGGLDTSGSGYTITPSGGTAADYAMTDTPALNDGDAIALSLSVAFPDSGSVDNDYNVSSSQLTSALSDLTVSATQDH